MIELNRIALGRGVSVIHNSGNVQSLYFDKVYSGWETYILLTSDRHHDSVDCNRELELKHLEEVKKRNGFILDVGDLFDCMQGKFDPRRTYNNLRPEYKVDNYLDEIVVDAARFYAPYAKYILMLGKGNHESSILKNTGVDLTSNLTHRLNTDHGGHIQSGGYGGWLRIFFNIQKTQRASINIKYYHGSGGGSAPVTRGVIQTNRQAVYLPDADVVVNGHSHDSWYMPISRERINQMGIISQDIQHHIRTSTYKRDYGDGSGGWHVEGGKPPKPMGACWLHLYFVDSKGSYLKIEPIADIE